MLSQSYQPNQYIQVSQVIRVSQYRSKLQYGTNQLDSQISQVSKNN